MKWVPASRSLFLTGIGEIWAAMRGKPRPGGERSGLALMVVSAAAFALMAAFAKKLLPGAPTQAVVFSRGVMMTTLFVALARREGASLVGSNPRLLLLRGLLGYGALSCYFWSVQHLPLGDAVLLQYSHPVFVAAMAPLFLREKTRRGQWPLILLALLGVALIVRPSGQFRPEALVGVTGSLMSGLAYMTIRSLSRTDHPLTILVWFPLATIPGSLVATIAAGRDALPASGAEVAGHLLVTASAFVGQSALTAGLARVGAARATAVSLAGPVFGVIFELVLFGQPPRPASLLGMAVVLTALGLLGASGGRPAGVPVEERNGESPRDRSESRDRTGDVPAAGGKR